MARTALGLRPWHPKEPPGAPSFGPSAGMWAEHASPIPGQQWSRPHGISHIPGASCLRGLSSAGFGCAGSREGARHQPRSARRIRIGYSPEPAVPTGQILYPFSQERSYSEPADIQHLQN